MTTTTTRSAVVLAAAACLAVLVGCASHGTAPGAGATGSPGISTTAAPSASASTPATTASAGTAPAGTAPSGQASAPRCHTSQLSMAFTGLNAAMGGQRGMTLILTNHSGSSCYVAGYPGLAFFTSTGAPLSTHLTWLTAPRATVVLRPDGNAQALLTWRVNMDTATPFNPGIVHITPPDEYAYLSTAWPGGPVLNGNIAAWPLTAAPAGPFPAGTGTVASPLNGMCMTLGTGDTVVAWKCNPGVSSQQWTGYSDGTLRINGSCLGVTGARVEVAACTGVADQKWRISQVSFNDFGSIVDAGTGTALTDPGGSTINGTRLVMGPDRGDQSYPWRVSFHPYLAG